MCGIKSNLFEKKQHILKNFASQENTLKGNSFNDMNSGPQFSQVNRKARWQIWIQSTYIWHYDVCKETFWEPKTLDNRNICIFSSSKILK